MRKKETLASGIGHFCRHPVIFCSKNLGCTSNPDEFDSESATAAPQLSFFERNPPPPPPRPSQLKNNEDNEDDNDDEEPELSLESSMESVTLLGQLQEPAHLLPSKESLSAQVLFSLLACIFFYILLLQRHTAQ